LRTRWHTPRDRVVEPHLGGWRAMAAVQKRKLIEVALPLEVINRESAREKSIRHGHPSTLHLWWARRPLAAARAVLFAQLVDDPSSLPEQFPTEELQKAERGRLHRIIERLVVWENIRDERLLAEARAEIMKSCDGNPPAILDPFAGGGTIPLEAQRLGLEAHASDLNPVAVLINKALIEIPPKFRAQRPVHPGLADSQIRTWKGAEGLAADVRAYGQWMRDEAEKRIGHYYPKAVVSTSSTGRKTEASVIAWIWARTVTCPNPACGIEMPLVRSWWLGKKKGNEAYVVPSVVEDLMQPSGLRVRFEIGHDPDKAPTPANDGTVSGRTGAVCLACQATAPVSYLRDESKAGRRGQALMAVVAEGNRRRLYVEPDDVHTTAAQVAGPEESIDGEIAINARWFSPPAYGLTKFSDLFTSRQLTALTTFSDLVSEARERVLKDALAAGMPVGKRLEVGGADATAYADAVATYLGLSVSRCADYWSSMCSWHSTRETLRNVFGRQAIPMTWDFAETMPLSDSTGGYTGQLAWVAKVLDWVPASGVAQVQQQDASTLKDSALISTDPPYYDNIGYSDLSDFFYVWQRRTLRDVYPNLLSTMLVPKAEELVANPYRHHGKAGAKTFFEDGFRSVFERARESAREDFPITVWYAFKQSGTSEDGTSSSGWETLLEGMIRSGWWITATWPNRSEMGNRMIASGTNALASSIVLALRPRPDDAPPTDRRGFIAALQAELPQALRDLQHGAIAPVDLPQAAIGPGMAVFSHYSGVIEGDGSKMTVRSSLARINEILDQVLNEQEGDFDPTTRFAIAWYRQHGYDTGQFGDANNIANARNTSVEVMDRDGILTSRAGKVTLQRPADLPGDYDVLADAHTSSWEAAHHLIRVLECEGVASAGEFLRAATSRQDGAVAVDLVKELAFLLFSLAEKNGWTKDALSFNTLATSWPEIVDAARTLKPTEAQPTLEFDEEEM
jgi:putative DNA methylase